MLKKFAQLITVILVLSMSLPLPVQAAGLYSISGMITTADGSGLAGVTVALGDLYGTTDSSGSYNILNVPEGSSGSLTPSKDDYTFDPASRAIDNISNNISSQNFSAVQKTTETTEEPTAIPPTTEPETVTPTTENASTTPTPESATATPTIEPTLTLTPTSTATQSGQDIIGAQTVTYTISGTIILDGSGLGGVKVTLDSHHSATTDASGGYIITNVPAGATGALTPSLAGYTFTPPNLPINNLLGSPVGQDFTASQLTYTVSGTITLNGSGLADVSVSDDYDSVNTDAQGNYSFSDIPYGTSLDLTPSLAGYTFNPSKISLSTIKSDQIGKNFAATAITLSVAGKVTLNGSAMAGVTISKTTSSGTISTTTNSTGNYLLSKIPYGSSFTLTPSKTNYKFNPASIDITNQTASLTGQNFTAAIITYDISGTVTASGAGLGGVKVTLNSKYAATTDGSGSYTIASVPIGTTGTLSAFVPGYNIPDTIAVTSLAGPLTNQDFTATALAFTYYISGKVTITIPSVKPPTIGFSGVTVSFGPYSTVTASDGGYKIALIAPGTTGTLHVGKHGFTFSPSQRTISAINSNRPGMDFATVQTSYTIYGKIYTTGKNLANVKIHITANGVPIKDGTTDNSGQYFLRNMPNGVTYVLTPELAGYKFSPSKTTIDELEDNSSDDFRGTLQYDDISGQISGLDSGDTVKIHYGTLSSQTVTTMANGIYALSLPGTKDYVLTPTSTDYRFDPVSRTIQKILPGISTDDSNQDFTATPQVIMSGKIAIQGRNIKGIIVTAAGANFSWNATTDASGNYRLMVPRDTAMTVTASDPYKYFVFESVDVTNSTSGANFIQDWNTATVTVTGHVAVNTNDLPGVVLSASALYNITPASATTNGAGDYSLVANETNTSNLSSFVLTPTIRGYTFSPRSQVISRTSGLVKNFAAIPDKWTVSGTVMFGLKPLSGVEIDAGIDSAPLRKVFTNSKGAYSLTGVPYDAKVTITAKKYGYSFTTADSYPFTMGDSNIAVEAFTATALDLNRTINGTITLKGTTTPLANVPVTLAYKGDTIFTTRTARNGTYSFPNLYKGDNATDYQVLPALAYYTFDPDPLSTTVDLTSTTDLAPSVALDFSATREATLSVKISGLPANTTVSFSINTLGGGNGPLSITPDSLSRYVILIPNPSAVTAYTVTPSLAQYIFSPLSSSFSIGPTSNLVSKTFTAVHQ